jgi:uncharacterized protein (TIGR00725 family)
VGAGGSAVARPHVAVVGPGQGDARVLVLAAEVGAELARRGAVLVTGGLGGAMEAACRGAREAGGTTIGILPGDDRRAANAWVDVAIATGMGELRNGLVVRCADALIAVGGGFGTLSEIGLALKAAKTVVGLGTWELGEGAVVAAASPADAVARALDGLSSAAARGCASTVAERWCACARRRVASAACRRPPSRSSRSTPPWRSPSC